MLKMLRYMKERWYYIVLIIALLFLQAYCDLALPDYTSKIVNVGIQQKGLEDGVPDTIREESMEQLCLFLDEKEADRVKENYTLKDVIYQRKEISKEEREELNRILSVPMMAAQTFNSEEEAAKLEEQMQLPEDTDLWQVLAAMPKEQFAQISAAVTEKMKEMPEAKPNLDALIENFDRALSHPDEADLNGLRRKITG